MSFTAAVLTVSDKASIGERVDTAGPAVCRLLEDAGYRIIHTEIIPDGIGSVSSALLHCADELKAALILTAGGTGFSPRDLTPEATKTVLEREVPGIPEAMRAASMRITPRGCLSRGVAGVRGGSLIVNLPGSEKAAVENLSAVLDPIAHGLEMLRSHGSADCAAPVGSDVRIAPSDDPIAAQRQQEGCLPLEASEAGAAGVNDMPAAYQSRGGTEPQRDKVSPKATDEVKSSAAPSLDTWLAEAKQSESSGRIGMYLFHNGVVRETPRAQVREGKQDAPAVKGMRVSFDPEKLAAAVEETKQLPGVAYARAWLNEGVLQVGDPIMLVLVGGDIRPHVVDALQFLVGQLKTLCVKEEEF